VARLGEPRDGGGGVLVTTPLSGWFGCAGERGTGIAVALALVEALARRTAVTMVATTGHELEFEGLRRYLAPGPPDASVVVHLGAGLAAGDVWGDHDEPVLGPVRLAMTSAVLTVTPALGDALAAAALPLVDLPRWPTEGQVWRDLGFPVLSLVGAFERFHTPEDVPSAVTSPALLARVASGVVEAVTGLLGDRAG
jgi:hypothetical protein